MKDIKTARLFDAIRSETTLERRIECATSRLLGLPYAENSLGGGPRQKETLTISFEGFDCVTFVETALALALAPTERGFIKTLRQLRYEDGRVEWAKRNHYMTDWAANNQARGVMVNLTRGKEAIKREKTLSLVDGLPEKKITLLCFSKKIFPRIAPIIETGDIILFASVKKRLDVFHTGIIIRHGDDFFLRHATRKVGSVIEQPLEDFLKENRMSGFILLRPASKERKTSTR